MKKVKILMCYRKSITRLLLLMVLVTAAYIPLSAQEDYPISAKVKMSSMYLLRYDTIPHYRASIGLLMVQPPNDMVETAIQAPLFNYHGILTLPWKLSLESDVTSLIVSNQVSLGPGFNLSNDNLGLKLGWDMAFVFGRLKQFGFNNTTKAWLHYPNISGSYQWNKMIFTVKAEAIIVASVETQTGENQLAADRNFNNGYSGAFYIEQRLHKNNVLIIGFKDSYVKYYWPVWLTFSTFDRFYHVPELSFRWII